VAVAAVDPIIPHVVFVGELNGLLARDKGLRNVWSAIEIEDEREDSTYQQEP
jgi:hypothetical protein